MIVFYNFSGGMESAAMLVLERERIERLGAVVRWADTGRHFPEMNDSLNQISGILDLPIVRVAPRITFDEFLFERGGMIRKGTTDCSRRMKRSNLMRHARQYPKPWEINLGFNAEETDRADEFADLNDREYCKWRFPLIELGIKRDATWEVCRKSGFTILVGMYEKMGRFDCYWCGNQTADQARKVLKHYPDLAEKWKAAEARKGHSFRPVPLALIEKDMNDPGLFAGCSCFGGGESVWNDED